MESIFLIFKMIVFLFAIIFLIKITLTKMNKYTQTQSQTIEIVERLSVGKESAIAIVSVCNKFYLMSMTTTSNELIKELDEEEVRELKAKKLSEQEFKNLKQKQVLDTIPNVISRMKLIKKEKQNEERP